MKKKKIYQGAIFLFFVTLIMAVGCFGRTSEVSAKERTIKVGQFDYPGFIDKDENGQYSGYAADYLKKISNYTDWEYEYVYDSWDNLLKKLAKGEIDLLCSAQYTKERDQVFDYAKNPLGYESSVLYVTKDNKSYYYDDYKAFDGMTIGTMKNSYQNGIFKEYAKKHGFSYKTKLYNMDGDMFDALDKGEIDAVLTGGLSAREDYKPVCEFSADPFYFTVTQGNTKLLNEVNEAMAQIRIQYPNIQEELYSKYYGGNKQDTAPNFTRDEMEYIKSVGTIRVGNQSNRFPFCTQNSKGKIYGIQVDLLDKISKMSGLKFKNEIVKDGVKAVDYLNKPGVRIFNGMPQSDFATFAPQLDLSDAVLTDSISFVAKKGSKLNANSHVTIAIPKGYVNGEKVLGARYPKAEVKFCNTKEDCLDDLADGKVDFVLLDSYMSNALLQKPYYDDLVSLDTYSVEQKLVIASLHTEDRRLISILNKCINRIGSNTRDSLVTKYTVTSQYQLTFSDYLYKYRTSFIFITILVACLVAVLVTLLMLRNRTAVRIQKANDKLEDTNEQLSKAIFEANQANKAKSDFLARMSHEIRTPMNAVIGETTIAQRNLSSQNKVEACLNHIMSSSRHLLHLINDILDMSAIESNKVKIVYMDFDIKEVIHDVSKLYYEQCNEKGIIFKANMINITKEIVVGDQMRIQQAVLNLLSNAVKFTPVNGTILLSVEQKELEDQKLMLRFVVQDSGCGMSEEYMQRIFKPFEQEHELTAKEHGGSGLGLSITKNLVELMGGDIEVESHVNQGTKIILTIPVKSSNKEQQMKSEEVSAIRTIVIDDDDVALEYISTILDHIGISYDTVNNGQEALHMITKARNDKQMYGLCLVDWKMEGMDGLELTKRIRKCCGDDPMIVVASAYDLNEIEEEVVQAGVDACITKPVFQSTIFNVLMSLSKGRLVNKTAKPDAYDFTGKRILLVDDIEMNREIASELLQMANCTVETAEDGKDALEKFEASKPGTYDVILMDIQMPVMNGYDATKAIRASKHPEAKTVCIVAMTANAFAEDIAKSLEVGMNDHISKPIDTELMYQIISRYM